MTSASPLFSVITVCLNRRDGLALTHASLARQTCQDVEWVVQDGGSKDGSGALLSCLDGPAPCCCTGTDRGLYDAMNRALERAQGEYVLFLNAGDELAGPDTLARLADELAGDPAPDLVYGDAWEETGQGWRLKRARDHRTAAWYGMFTHHQAILYRRAALGSLRFRTRYRIAADYAFTLEALAEARTIRRVAFPLCRFAADGESQRQAALGRQEQARIRRDLLGLSRPAVVAVAAVQRAALALRRAWPGLYGRLRYGAGPRPAV